MNLQNIPIRNTDLYRKCFVPQWDGWIGGVDYSSMELRLLADLSKDSAWLEIFEKDLDAHSEVGSRIYRKPIRKPKTLGPDDPGENWDLRKKSKELNLGRYEKTSRE